MDKKDSKNVKQQHPAFVYRAVSDFYYAFHVMLFGTKYLDSDNKLVVQAKHELTEAMNNFSCVMAKVLGVDSSSVHGEEGHEPDVKSAYKG